MSANHRNGANGASNGASRGHGLAAAPRPDAKLSPAEIAARTLPSLVRIVTPRTQGTGFVVRGDGVIASNLHLVDGATEATLVLFDGREVEDIQVLTASDLCDLVLLRVPTTGLLPLVLGDSTAVQPGDTVVAVDHAPGEGGSVADGVVSGIRTLQGDVNVLSLSGPIAPSTSGGPLLNERGEVIAVCTLVVSRGQDLSVGMPVSYLKQMLDAVSAAEDVGVPLPQFAEARARSGLRRDIPRHDLSLLDDCTDEQLEMVREAIWGAINVGAPLYNEGNHEACFRIYEGLALDLERRAPGMVGVKQALMAGVERAGRSEGYTQKAWDLRDTFDGLLDVIDRRLGATRGGPPGLQRDVPSHDLTLLADCSEGTLRAVASAIVAAIEVGAPLYNDGNAEACFLIYQGAALDLTRKLDGCNGARQALLDGVERAATLQTPEEKAWAMRDAFDGLLDVIERRLRGGAKA